MVAMLRVCHEAHHLHYGAQGMALFLLKWVYLGVAETIVGLLLCCGGGILFSVFSIVCITSFGDYTHLQHQATIKNIGFPACPWDQHLSLFAAFGAIACLSQLIIMLQDDLPGPFPNGQVTLKTYLLSKDESLLVLDWTRLFKPGCC